MKNCLDTNVTIFKNYWTKTGGQQYNLLKLLKCDKYYAQQLAIAELREIELSSYKRKKALFICFLPSCKDCTERSAKAQYVHNGLIQIDIDQKDNPHIKDWHALRHDISTIPNVAYCGLSISGFGLWCLIPISDPLRHLEYFYYLEEVFLRNGLKIDPSCKNVQRLRGYSYDPAAYFNFYATPLTEYTSRKQKSSKFTKLRNNSQIEATINYIVKNNIDLAPDYDEYLDLAFCFSYEYGLEGMDYFLRICSTHVKYNEKEAIKKFHIALKDNKGLVKMGSFYHLCGLKGIEYKKWGRVHGYNNSPLSHTIYKENRPDIDSKNESTQIYSPVEKLLSIEHDGKQNNNEDDLYYYEKDFIKLQNEAILKLKDPAYLKWVMKEINKIIEMRIPRKKSSPDIKQLFQTISILP